MKKIGTVLLLFCLLLSLAGCRQTSDGNPEPIGTQTGAEPVEVQLSNFDRNSFWDETETTVIVLKDGGTQVEGPGVEVNGDTVRIIQEGTYLLSGTLSDGQITVAAEFTEKVHLILNGVSVTGIHAVPLYVECADKVCVTLAENTKNTFCDTDRPQIPDDEEDLKHNINACIYACDDLSFNGNGKLIVRAANNGIGCKNDIRIADGTYDIRAAKNAIKGKNSVFIAGGTLTLNAGNDGIKSTNLKDADKGFVRITGGTIKITARDDGIQAVHSVTVTDGSVVLHAADEKINCLGIRQLADGCVR